MTEVTAHHITPNYRRHLLGLMMLCQIFNYLDRQLPAILLPSIKKDLLLTDTQLGFITGLAFAAFYAVVGIPLGRLSDSLSRRKFMTACIGAWSIATAATGMATSFFTMACASSAPTRFMPMPGAWPKSTGPTPSTELAVFHLYAA